MLYTNAPYLWNINDGDTENKIVILWPHIWFRVKENPLITKNEVFLLMYQKINSIKWTKGRHFIVENFRLSDIKRT